MILGTGPADARRWYRTLVHRVDQQTVWVEGAPPAAPRVQVEPGEEVTCHTWRYMDAAYQIHAKVAFARLDPEPLYGLAVRDLERIQKRAYVRVPVSAEAWAYYLGSATHHVDLDEAMEHPLHIDVRDLSAGGLRGRANLLLEPGDELEIDLALPRSEREIVPPTPQPSFSGKVIALPELSAPLSLRARVVRLIDTGIEPTLECEIGVAFLDMPRAAQERIIRFALDVQRERRRRGLL
ncbi:MAG: PilZ domain-containing protein [Chloroflexi bacterium]|nr:PilZ domain-containing protein [Chloroflexota bacterium]